MERIFVDSQRRLADLLAAALQAPRIGVDLESDGLFRYRPQLCTLQLRVGEVLAVIDTLMVPDLTCLQPVLGADGPLKVIHDVSFDARLLHRYGIALGHVFDTALAARFVGCPGTGLSTLLQARCAVTLDKQLQQHDWGLRPLKPHTVNYLYDDVAHLFCLHDSLAADVDSLGIGTELADETRYTLEQATVERAPDPKPPWLRVKRAATLPPLQQAVLRELCALRERLAEDANVPPFRILHDRMLLELAERRPSDAAGLRRGPGRLPPTAQELIPAVLEAIARGSARQAPPVEELASLAEGPTPEERTRRRRVEKALSSWRKEEAERRGVDVQVVLPGHALHDLAARRPTSPEALQALRGLGETRCGRYGSTWLALIAHHGDAAPAGSTGA